LISPLRGVNVVEFASERRESVPVDDIKGMLDARIDLRRSLRD
jgi:hypothetical protein